ncbi:M3 family oligoendopeptidase [Bacillus suaedaesalsae]|uniref:M3 family oligoendopeptidase n=1 Tax=Bacillus suaedaesalsae TaxID=2810349 RepID=A0ABS2DHM5_9BACI|nr:M3 family oligoendopeptidase [Bacillus suaedaesalsae]MBM6617991.1 M3 family oligoendopeptidase [Bacillus suaedaesalsae]
MSSLEHSLALDMNTYEDEFTQLLQRFESSTSYIEQQQYFEEINRHRFYFEASLNFARLQYYLELTNEKHKETYLYLTKLEPRYLQLVTSYYRTILNATYRNGLEQHYGKQLFLLAEIKQSSYSKEVEKEINKENQLLLEYNQLRASAKINFQGNTLNLSTITPYLTNNDREIRKQAHLAKSEFYKENEDKFDQLLDELVKIRHSIATKLGYSSFVELGYHRMNRTSNNSEDLRIYRNEVKTVGVPFISKLKKMQQQRIGVKQLKYYDENYVFPNGLPKPQGTDEEIMSLLHRMFTELSPETKEFFEYMISKNLMDTESREHKIGGNFATFISKDQLPFIFTNFHGTSNDIRVFTHEAGHAFQFYMSIHWNIPEYLIPYDSCEIFSFAMERLTWPWMELFFGEETNLYKFSHLTNAFMFMPVASVIDEFEHYLYENPTASITERKHTWRKFEKEYLPERDYDDNEFWESGTSFYDFAHLFLSPFYFMDYDLAHFLSVQLWEKSQTNPNEAWKCFLEMCHHGGHHSFNEHIKSAKLYSPFEEGSLKQLLSSVEKWIEQNKID